MQPEIQQAKDELAICLQEIRMDWMDQLAGVLMDQLALAKKEVNVQK